MKILTDGRSSLKLVSRIPLKVSSQESELDLDLDLPREVQLKKVPEFNSAIHKTTGLTVPGRSVILPGTIPETSISREWSRRLERPLGVVPTAGRQLCE